MKYYEYDPKSPKKREKLAAFGLLALAALLFGVARIPGIPYPALLQLCMVFALIGMVMLISRCLLRQFIYTVCEPESGDRGVADLVITERYGNHVTVVCRISVGDIAEITRMTAENRRETSEMLRRQRVYHYTAQLWGDGFYLLRVLDEDEVFYLRIVADDGLISTIKSQQIATNVF